MEGIFTIIRTTSNHIDWQDGQKEKIVELYNQKYSLRKISEMFGGLHKNTIKKVLDEYNVNQRTAAQSHYKDNRKDDIFSVIDNEEKAYWLGFLAADGCVSGNYIIITLKAEDKTHLEKFKKFLQADSIKIQDIQKWTNFEGEKLDKFRYYSQFTIGCKRMAEDLKKHGIVENKTLVLQPPLTIPEEFYMDWIRGYFDGDGSISFSSSSNRWQSNCVSTKEVCQWMVERLDLKTSPYTESKYHNKNTYVIHFNGRLILKKVFDKIYRNNTATIYLDRKYKIYLHLLSTFN